LPSWRIVNVPIMKDMNLRTFWGDSLVRLVGYEFIDNTKVEKSNGGGKHEQRCLNYLFCAQAEYIPEGREIIHPVQTSAQSLVLDKTSEESTLSWKIARPSVSRSFYLQQLDFGIPQPAEKPPSSALSKSTST